ncbi:hypothetical protein [Burkholderia gladioli]|uniref:hypothetical protein n=1 Tax=Burkholderia gladioli TaxID=28095 RepID=UPI0016419270|nr:hypothetical protein [Burkholderia gladioli]
MPTAAASLSIPTVSATICAEHSLCFELAKGLPAALVALVAAILAGTIAYQQYRVAKAKLSLDLFEKRYELFEIVWTLASSVTTKGVRHLHVDERIAMTNVLPKIEFLFGRDLAAYVREINIKFADLWVITAAVEKHNGVMPQEHVHKHTELMEWFADAAQVTIRKRFGEYLDFEVWRGVGSWRRTLLRWRAARLQL